MTPNPVRDLYASRVHGELSTLAARARLTPISAPGTPVAAISLPTALVSLLGVRVLLAKLVGRSI